MNQIVTKWMDRATNNFKESKFDPQNVILKAWDTYDGRDETVRKKEGTNLTKAIVTAMHKAYPSAAVAIFNAGSIRVDDMIIPPISEYDIIRALPYIDSLKLVEMNGDILIRLLNTGLNLPKDDGMLLHHTTTLLFDDATKTWKLGSNAIQSDTKYKVVLANYLLSGKQQSLEFLKGQFTNITPASPTLAQTDINHALIEHLKQLKP
jgi:5'-nucleotidase